MLLRTCVTFTTRKNIFSLKEGFHGDLNPFDFFSYWHLWRWKKMWLIFLWFNDLVVETGNAAGLKTPHLIPANKGRNVPLLDLFLWVLGNFWLFVWWLRSSNPTWIKMKKYLRVPIFGGELKSTCVHWAKLDIPRPIECEYKQFEYFESSNR